MLNYQGVIKLIDNLMPSHVWYPGDLNFHLPFGARKINPRCQLPILRSQRWTQRHSAAGNGWFNWRRKGNLNGIYYGYHGIDLPTKYSQKGKTIEQKVASWRRTWGMIEFGAPTWILLGSWLRMNKLHRLFWLFIGQSASGNYVRC